MRFVLVVLMMVFAGPALAQATTPAQVLDAAVNQVIRPGMANFKSRASGLESAMSALCAMPGESTLAIASQQFRQAALAYGGVEFLRIGPLMEDNRADRLLFFPDRKGIGLKQVQTILAEEDQAATGVMSLRDKSIAVQGFGALEFVLFGTGAETLLAEGGQFRCRYGAAIAANISLISDELALGWYSYDGVASHLTMPMPDYVDYRSETEAMEAIVGLVSHGIESVRDTRINPFMPDQAGRANPKLALFWRAGLSMDMIRANLDGLRKMVALSGMARAVSETESGLDNSIDFEFGNAFRALDLVTSTVDEALADPKQVQALNYLVIVTQSLQAVVGEQLAFALGLSVGFSSLDGD